MPANRPLLITIDTEGDNLWALPRVATTRNAAFLPRFQALCERYGFAPTWLVDYVMAGDGAFVEFGRDVLARGTGEIGVHPHAWNTPPDAPFTDNDAACMPYLVEYPEPMLRAKLAMLTDRLEETFSNKMVSHRAGRWAFDDVYARALADRGFRVDCSVTPGVDWRRTPGRPGGAGGTDYSSAPTGPYRLHTGRASTLWEVPMTIRPAGGTAAALVRRAVAPVPFVNRAWNRLYPAARWFRPRPGNRAQMHALLHDVIREDAPYVEFMLHSSELMPGGSPTFTDDVSIDRLYADLESVFDAARSHGCVGMTLARFADRLDASGPVRSS